MDTAISTANHTPDDEAMIVATLVADNRRLNFLPNYFGNQLMIGEALTYRSLESISKDYNGGYWEFYELSNGGFYMAPQTTKTFHVECTGNYFEGDLSADAAGIVACLMSINQLAWKTQADRFSDLFHLLREYALSHPEASLILGAID